MEVCPSCKKKHKNLILHIKKSTKCINNVSEEEMKIIEDHSKNRRRQYKKITMKERRRKVKDETKERKEDKEHHEDMNDTEENEVPKKSHFMLGFSASSTFFISFRSLSHSMSKLYL